MVTDFTPAFPETAQRDFMFSHNYYDNAYFYGLNYYRGEFVYQYN